MPGAVSGRRFILHFFPDKAILINRQIEQRAGINQANRRLTCKSGWFQQIETWHAGFLACGTKFAT
jgi:hypothetical protein